MKKRITAVLTACAALLCGCSQTGAQSSTAETLPPMTEVPDPVLMYYVSDHGTTDTAELTQFLGRLSESGYTVQEDALGDIPMNADAVILSDPQEDLTSDELSALDRYMDQGGHVLLLMQAQESETRFKYLGRFLEEYCIIMDYDRLSESDASRMLNDDPTHLLINQIHAPTGMTIVPETAERPLYMHNVRSFHFAVLDSYDTIQQDVMLKSADTVTGEPFGGTEDDPIAFEGEPLTSLLFSRDEARENSFVVCSGASDFLLDANFTAESSLSAQDYIFAALDWMANPIIF